MNSRVIITAEDQTSAGINSVRTSMAGLGATVGVFAAATQVAIGAIGEMASQTIGLWKEQVKLADSMDEMSIRMAMSIKDLTYWKTAAEMNGATRESMAAGTRMLSKHMVEHGAALRKAGIDTADANKAFLQLSDLFAGMTDPVARLDLATKLFGRGIGQQLLPTLVMGSKALLDIKEATDGYGAALERLSPEAQKANDGLALMGVNFKQAATEGVYPLVKSFNDEMLPALREVTKEGSLLKMMFVGFGGLMKITFTNPLNETLLGAKATLQQFAADTSSMLAGMTFGKVAENHLREAQRMQAAARATLAEAAKYRPGSPAAAPPALALPGANSDAEAAALRKSLGGGDKSGAARSDPFATLMKGIDERTSALAAEAQSTDRLSESQKFALKLMTDLQGGYLKLTDAQKVTLATRLETLLAVDHENQKTEALRKTMLEQVKAAEQAADAQRKVLAAMEDKAAAAEFELQTFGMTRDQIEGTTIARLEERRAMYAGLDGHEQELAALEREIAARKRLRDAFAGIDAKEATRKAIGEQEKEWKRFTEEVDRSLTDALMRGFENGKGGGQAFIDSIKNSLKTAAFKVMVQAVVNPVMGAAGSALGVPGTMSGGGVGGGVGNLFSLGNSASNLFGGATAAYNTVAYQALGSMGMEQAAMLAAQDAVFGAAGTAATLEAAGASAFASTIGAALPYVGLALAAGSMLGLFDGGGDDPHNNPQASGYHMYLSKAGVAGAAGLASPSSFLAGPTSGTGWWGDNTPMSTEQIAALNKQTAVAFAQGRALAQLLGTDPAAVDSAVVVSTTHGVPGNGGIVGYFASIEQAFAALGDAIASKVIPNLDEFQTSGESLAQTAQRLTQEFTLTNRMAEVMGRDAATAFGGNNLKARDDLIQALGGLGGASSTFASYYANFHSERERAADARGSIENTLRAIGIADVPATRQQFRDLVEGQDLATESGRAMYATLLSVSDAFAGIAASADEAARAMGTDRFRTRADYLFAKRTGVIPAYADGGSHGGGWAMVGERGMELAYMPPAQVYSNRDSKALLDMGPVTQAINALRADMLAVNASMVRAANKTAKVLDKWDGDGMPMERVT